MLRTSEGRRASGSHLCSSTFQSQGTVPPGVLTASAFSLCAVEWHFNGVTQGCDRPAPPCCAASRCPQLGCPVLCALLVFVTATDAAPQAVHELPRCAYCAPLAQLLPCRLASLGLGHKNPHVDCRRGSFRELQSKCHSCAVPLHLASCPADWLPSHDQGHSWRWRPWDEVGHGGGRVHEIAGAGTAGS